MTDAPAAPADLELLHQRINGWFAGIARDLPWRKPDCSPWANNVAIRLATAGTSS